MTVVDCTAPLNRYTCYGAIEVVAIIIIIIIIIINPNIYRLHCGAKYCGEFNPRNSVHQQRQTDGIAMTVAERNVITFG